MDAPCMNSHTKNSHVGIVPLYAFFIGAGLTAISCFWNERTAYAGGWSDLSRAVVLFFILAGASVYVAIFGAVALAQFRKYRNLTSFNATAAKAATILYGCTAIVLVFVWLVIAAS